MSISLASEPESSLMTSTGSEDQRGGGEGGGRLFKGGNYFKYFGQRGRGGGVIIRGRQLIEGRLLFEEIRYICRLKSYISARLFLLAWAHNSESSFFLKRTETKRLA